MEDELIEEENEQEMDEAITNNNQEEPEETDEQFEERIKKTFEGQVGVLTPEQLLENEKLLKERRSRNLRSIDSKTKERVIRATPTILGSDGNVLSQEKLKEEEEKLRKEYNELTTVFDRVQRKRVPVDFNNPDHRMQIAKQNRDKVAIYIPANSKIWKTDKNAKRGDRLIELKRSAYAADIDLKNGELDFIPLINPYLKKHEMILNEIIALLPVLNLPIYTPKLLLFLTEWRMPEVIDSLQAFRVYFVILKLLNENTFLNSTVTISTAWIKNKMKMKTLTREEFKEWLSAISFYGEEEEKIKKENEEEFKKELGTVESMNGDGSGNANNTEEKMDEVEKKKPLQSTIDINNIKSILFDSFQEGVYNKELITDEFISKIKSVSFYDSLLKDQSNSWRFIGLPDAPIVNMDANDYIHMKREPSQKQYQQILFKEEVMSKLQEEEETLVTKFSIETSALIFPNGNKEGNEDDIQHWHTDNEKKLLTALSKFTISLLNWYEISIMRLLSKECLTTLGLSGIPLNRRQEFLCVQFIPAPFKEDKSGGGEKKRLISEELKRTMCEERDRLTNLRNKNILNLTIDEQVPFSDYGTSIQLYCLAKYLIFDPTPTATTNNANEETFNVTKGIEEDLKSLKLQRIENISKEKEIQKDESKKKKLMQRQGDLDQRKKKIKQYFNKEQEEKK